MNIKPLLTFLIAALAVLQGQAQLELASSHFIGFHHQTEVVDNDFLYQLEPLRGNYYGVGFLLFARNTQVTLGAGITNTNLKLQVEEFTSGNVLLDPIQISSQNSYLTLPITLSTVVPATRRWGMRCATNRPYARRGRFHLALTYNPSFLLESQSIVRAESTISRTDQATNGLYPTFQHALIFSTICKIYPTRKTALLIEPFAGVQANYFENNQAGVVDGYQFGITLKVQFHSVFKVTMGRPGLSEKQQKRLEEKQQQIKDHLDKH